MWHRVVFERRGRHQHGALDKLAIGGAEDWRAQEPQTLHRGTELGRVLDRPRRREEHTHNLVAALGAHALKSEVLGPVDGAGTEPSDDALCKARRALALGIGGTPAAALDDRRRREQRQQPAIPAQSRRFHVVHEQRVDLAGLPRRRPRRTAAAALGGEAVLVDDQLQRPRHLAARGAGGVLGDPAVAPRADKAGVAEPLAVGDGGQRGNEAPDVVRLEARLADDQRAFQPRLVTVLTDLARLALPAPEHLLGEAGDVDADAERVERLAAGAADEQPLGVGGHVAVRRRASPNQRRLVVRTAAALAAQRHPDEVAGGEPERDERPLLPRDVRLSVGEELSGCVCRCSPGGVSPPPLLFPHGVDRQAERLEVAGGSAERPQAVAAGQLDLKRLLRRSPHRRRELGKAAVKLGATLELPSFGNACLDRLVLGHSQGHTLVSSEKPPRDATLKQRRASSNGVWCISFRTALSRRVSACTASALA